MQKTIVLYDGHCAYCRGCVKVAQRFSCKKTCFLPYQLYSRHFPIVSQEQCAQALQYIDHSGNLFSGAAAACKILEKIPLASVIAWLYFRVRPIRLLFDHGYRWISKKRHSRC